MPKIDRPCGALPPPNKVWTLGRTAGQISAVSDAIIYLASFDNEAKRLEFTDFKRIGEVFEQEDTGDLWMYLGEIEELPMDESWIKINFDIVK